MRIHILASGLIAAAMLAPAAASAQSQLDARVDRLESQMHAVQRKVFPGGSGQYFQPQIAPPITEPGRVPESETTSPVTDLTARVVALEEQLSSLTNQIEEGQHQLRSLRDEFEAYKASAAASTPVVGAVTGGSAPIDTADGGIGGAPEARGGGVLTPPPGGASPAPDAFDDRARAATVERPSTGDPADDAYVYGYRLWAAKLYPEAEKQLKSVVAKYPNHRRASWAQNLLGRAYLDEGKPSLASIAFYDNYKKYPDGERAPDSLYYLAQALIQLKKPSDACKVYGELTDVYGDRISASMRDDVVRGRREAKCS